MFKVLKLCFFQDYENNQEFLKQVNVESLNKYLFFAFFSGLRKQSRVFEASTPPSHGDRNHQR
jgi:hypothetical protein